MIITIIAAGFVLFFPIAFIIGLICIPILSGRISASERRHGN